MKNFKKKLASLLALVSMVSCMSAIPTYALSTGALPVSNKIVDNDPLSGAGSMTRSGFDTYIKASGLWNGDARKQTCSSNTTYYI